MARAAGPGHRQPRPPGLTDRRPASAAPARSHLALHAGTFAYAAGDLTDAGGRYDIDVDLGGYRLLFYDPSGDREAEWYNNVPLTAMLESVPVTTTATARTKRRDVSLAPVDGAATGRITDAATGDPVPGSWAVFLDVGGRVVAGGVAASDGGWAVGGVPVGVSRVTFVDPTGGHRQEYWGDSDGFGAADVIRMVAGDAVTGLDAALSPSG